MSVQAMPLAVLFGPLPAYRACGRIGSSAPEADVAAPQSSRQVRSIRDEPAVRALRLIGCVDGTCAAANLNAPTLLDGPVSSLSLLACTSVYT